MSAATATALDRSRAIATPPSARVFVIDDDEVMLLSCRRILEKDGYAVETFESGTAGLARLAEAKPQLLLVDLKMPELDGLQVIARVREIDPDLVIAVITGYATIATAVDAMKAGAYDFLPKPFTPDELRLVVRRGCERWRLREEARQAHRAREAAERRVITFVSHQLKSPLAAAKQYLDVLLHTSGDTFPPTTAEWLGRSQARLQEMVELIDDWLTLAHAERGTLGQRDGTTQIADVIAQAIAACVPQADRAGVTVSSEMPRDLPLVSGDTMSLATVVSNLVTNAIKYNRQGGVVTIRAASEPAAVRVEVQDTGRGIPRDSLERVFYRVPESKIIAGTGLGLAICRRVLEELGGSIAVASTPGVGSTFTIRVPRAIAAKGSGMS
jgi:signal transduction histidine kinase